MCKPYTWPRSTLGVVADTDVSRGQIHDGGGNEKRRDVAGSTIKQIYMLALNHVEPADSGADVYSGPGQISSVTSRPEAFMASSAAASAK